MAKADDTQVNSKVYFPQGANRLGVDSDGEFDFYGNSRTGSQLKAALFTNQQILAIAASAGVLSLVNLNSGGVVFISGSVGCSDMSAWLPSCEAGQRLYVVFRRNGMGDESVGSVFISLSGVSLVGLSGQDLSSISLQNSDGSAGYIEFLAVADNEWAVLERNQGKTAERPSA